MNGSLAMICVRLAPAFADELPGLAGPTGKIDFLIDTGADRTVFSANLLARLGIPR